MRAFGNTAEVVAVPNFHPRHVTAPLADTAVGFANNNPSPTPTLSGEREGPILGATPVTRVDSFA